MNDRKPASSKSRKPRAQTNEQVKERVRKEKEHRRQQQAKLRARTCLRCGGTGIETTTTRTSTSRSILLGTAMGIGYYPGKMESTSTKPCALCKNPSNWR